MVGGGVRTQKGARKSKWIGAWRNAFLGLSLDERPGKKKKKARNSYMNPEEFQRAFSVL